MSELISDNAEQRAFTAAAMNTLQCQFLGDHISLIVYRLKIHIDTMMAWIPLVWFQQIHQPNGMCSFEFFLIKHTYSRT